MKDRASRSKAPRRIAIQGRRAAFHELAARRAFAGEEVEIVSARTFAGLVALVEAGKADAAVMAIENTLAGSIMDNYRLLQQSDLCIKGEVYLHIEQNLLALPGTRLEDLREVHSHPMALAQCREFLKQYPHIRLVESEDTAYSALLLSEQRTADRAAIASALAAEVYGLEILAAGIETHKQNHTRFLVLMPFDKLKAAPFGRLKAAPFGKCCTSLEADKVSISFALPHRTGSLHGVLAVLSAYQFNLTKIQSAPIVGKPWEYLFFIDFIRQGAQDVEQALEAIRPITHGLRVFGVYPDGNPHRFSGNGEADAKYSSFKNNSKQ